MKKVKAEHYKSWVDNEIDANKQLSTGSLYISGLVIVMWIFIVTQVFNVDNIVTVNIILPIAAVMLVIPFFVIKINKKVNHSILKYFILFNFSLVIGMLNLVIPKHAIIAWAAIILLAAHYYSVRATVMAFVITAVFMAIDLPLCMLFGEWDGNLMGVTDTTFMNLYRYVPEHPLPNGGHDPYNLEDRIYFLNHFDYYSTDLNRWVSAFVYYYMGRFVCLLGCFILAIRLTKRTERLLVSEATAREEKGRLSAELNVARDIQLSALPQSFPELDKYDVYALTHPAKEVGGDFYNCFQWRDRLLFFIADVSGKGVPAALLMMKTNTLISSLLKNDSDPSKALKYTNKELNDHNEKGMFVTSIVGSLDLTADSVVLSNAGHNPLLMKRNGQGYEYVKLPAGFVLGGLSHIDFTNTTFKLNKDDVLFIYTDGVTEAMNENGELFGEERLQSFLNSLDPSLSSEEICRAVNDEVHRFTGEADQADDITMLCLKCKDSVKRSSFVLPADKNEVEKISEFVNNFLEPFNVNQKDLSQIDIVIDEICSNIFNYAYEGKKGNIEVDVSYENDEVTIDFIDNGAPFNPLEKEDPNINLSLEERKVGGLGIYIVKQMMDSVSYRYSEEKQNILTIKKKVGK